LNSSLFETIACPLCGSAEFDVVKPARYGADLTAEKLRKTYSASSHDRLLDQVVRCRVCMLHYINPRPLAQLIIDSYSSAQDETYVEYMDDRIGSFQRVLRRVLRISGRPEARGRLLDVGCAAGACLAAAKTMGFDVSGVEPSSWLAAFGRRKYGIDIRDGILEPGMFPKESADVITLWDVLEHVPNPRALLELIQQLLRPDGIFVVSYPDFHSVTGRLLGDRWPFWLGVHVLYYDKSTIARQLRTCGFDVIGSFSYWPTLPFGYILDRAIRHVPSLKFLGTLRDSPLGRMKLTYNAGQRVVVARRR
jgi:SAM-dependent methyltransferase